MRVIAGTARGRRIAAPPGHAVRPTSDRVRQATFNALVHRNAVEGARVLDLFAGSGALGIEALSRGAASVTFVDSDRTATRFIRENLAALGFAAAATVVQSDALRWSATSAPFDLAFADPPYAFSDWAAMLERLATMLAEDAVAVLEGPDEIDPGFGWDVVRQQRYGGTVITLAVRAAPPA